MTTYSGNSDRRHFEVGRGGMSRAASLHGSASSFIFLTSHADLIVFGYNVAEIPPSQATRVPIDSITQGKGQPRTMIRSSDPSSPLDVAREALSSVLVKPRETNFSRTVSSHARPLSSPPPPGRGIAPSPAETHTPRRLARRCSASRFAPGFRGYSRCTRVVSASTRPRRACRPGRG